MWHPEPLWSIAPKAGTDEAGNAYLEGELH